MIIDEHNKEYFKWMCRLVETLKMDKTYRKLMTYLFEVEFTYSIPMDANRESDGIDLRYRFGYETGKSDSYIASYIDIRPCSVLEMMVALALRCEREIMSSRDYGDRTGEWFWAMIHNLGLGDMDDTQFDIGRTDDIVSRFLNREFAPDGKGSLFTVKNARRDMRDVELWYQMSWYLDEVV